jgi:putative flippase GtrA
MRPAKFLAVGALGIGVQLGLIEVLTLARLPYLLATTMAVSGAVIHNFIWHRRWTWRDRSSPAIQGFVRFAGANGVVSLGGNVAMMWFLVGAAHVHPVPANLIAIAASGALNYWLSDTFVFGSGLRWPQSARSAVSGSTREARQAGSKPARMPTATNPSPAIAIVCGSRGERP